MVLTSTDRNTLHDAIVEYLEKHGLPDAAGQVKAGLAAQAKFADLETALERRWSIVVRLTRKNTELETRIKALESEVSDLRDPTKSAGAGAGGSASSAPLAPAAPEIAAMHGHRDTLTAVAFHPFETLAFSAGEDATVRVWDLENRQLKKTLTEHGETVSALSMEMREGRLLASASKDTSVKIYDTQAPDFACMMTLHHDDAVTDVKWDPDAPGTLVSSTRAGDVLMWDSSRAALKGKIEHRTWVHSLAVAAGHVCVGDRQGKVTLYVASTKQVANVYVEHTNIVDTVCFSTEAADATFIAQNGTSDQKAFLREVERRKEQAKLAAQLGVEGSGSGSGGSGAPTSSASSSSSSLVTTSAYLPRFIVSGGRDKNVIMRDATSGALAFKFEGHENWVRALAFTKAGKHLVTCGDDGLMFIVDVATTRVHRKITAHDHFATCLAVHPAGKPIAITGSADKLVKLWPCKP